MLLDDFLPVYDVSDSVATVAAADVHAAWEALLSVDLIQVGRDRPLVAALGGLRAMPEVVSHVLHGEPIPRAPERLLLRQTADLAMGEGGWVLLGEREDDELALGLVGKFWRPVITYAKVSAEEFRGFDEPGFAKTVYSLSVNATDDGRTLITGTMRTATTDDVSRRWFRRYWTLGVGSGAHVLVQGVVDAARASAERAARQESEG